MRAPSAVGASPQVAAQKLAQTPTFLLPLPLGLSQDSWNVCLPRLSAKSHCAPVVSPAAAFHLCGALGQPGVGDMWPMLYHSPEMSSRGSPEAGPFCTESLVPAVVSSSRFSANIYPGLHIPIRHVLCTSEGTDRRFDVWAQHVLPFPGSPTRTYLASSS